MHSRFSDDLFNINEARQYLFVCLFSESFLLLFIAFLALFQDSFLLDWFFVSENIESQTLVLSQNLVH